MKNKSETSFQGLVRAKLSELEVSLPPNGLSTIRQQLAARRRKRRMLLLVWLFFLLGTSAGILWLRSNESSQAGLRANYPELESSQPPAESVDDGKDNPTLITPLKKENAKPPPTQAYSPEEANNIPPQDQAVIAAFSDTSFLSTPYSQVQVEKEPSPKDSPEKKEEEVMAIANDLWSEVVPLLQANPIKTVIYENHYSPVFSFVQPTSKAKKPWSWNFSFTPGLHFYHLHPNQTDDIHFYAFDNTSTDRTFQTSISLNHSLSSRWSIGIQAQHLFTQTSIQLHSIEKETGQVAIIKKQTEDELYRNYRSRLDLLEGSFHQWGIGGQVSYHLIRFSGASVQATAELNYVSTLNNDSPLFPNQGFGTSIGLNWEQPLGKSGT